jgi:hypothetical protein
MKKTQKCLWLFAAFLLLLNGLNAQKKPGDTPLPADTAKKTAQPSLTDKVKSCRKITGLLTMYQDTATGSVQLYVKKTSSVKNLYTRVFLWEDLRNSF